MHFKKLYDVRSFLGGTFQPRECLLLVAESQVSIEERGGWDITLPSSPVKLVENPQRFCAATTVSVSVDEHSKHSGTAIRQGSSFLQSVDRIVKLPGPDERKTKKPHGQRILWFN